MSLDDILGRLLNPTILVTMIAAGIPYAWFLWSLHIQPAFRLWAAATFPGVMFLAVIWAIRGFQGTMSAVYIALAIDWLLFAQAGFIAVLGYRALRRRRTT